MVYHSWNIEYGFLVDDWNTIYGTVLNAIECNQITDNILLSVNWKIYHIFDFESSKISIYSPNGLFSVNILSLVLLIYHHPNKMPLS